MVRSKLYEYSCIMNTKGMSESYLWVTRNLFRQASHHMLKLFFYCSVWTVPCFCFTSKIIPCMKTNSWGERISPDFSLILLLVYFYLWHLYSMCIPNEVFIILHFILGITLWGTGPGHPAKPPLRIQSWIFQVLIWHILLHHAYYTYHQQLNHPTKVFLPMIYVFRNV